MAKQETPGNEVATQGREVKMFGKGGASTVITAEQLQQMSFDEIAAFLNGTVGVVEATEAIGTDQFGPILEDKSKLIGVPFLLVHWEGHDSDKFGGTFVSLWIITQDGNKYIVNDGSTGIAKQLLAMKEHDGITSGIVCKHGLRASEYTTGPDHPATIANKGIPIQATTYYIDTKL